MVDEADSKSVGSDTVWVRVPPPAPSKEGQETILVLLFLLLQEVQAFCASVPFCGVKAVDPYGFSTR